MNIFFVSDDPSEAARSLCDRHIVKMILESTQMICACYHVTQQAHKLPPELIMKPVHQNHVSTRWIRLSSSNFEWICIHLETLVKEYDQRYNNKKAHFRSRNLLNEFDTHPLSLPSNGLTYPHLAFGDTSRPDLNKVYKKIQSKYGIWSEHLHAFIADWPTSVKAYQEYVCFKTFKDKAPLTWKQNKPDWYTYKSPKNYVF